jgi:spore coat polysaccharide biosynthesis protein SpsF
MKKKVSIIVEARMNSTRLPGKVLKNIIGKTVIELLLNRLKSIKKIDKIIIATTKNSKDDLIEEFEIGRAHV